MRIVIKKLNIAFKAHPSSSDKIIRRLSKKLNIKIIRNDFEDINWKKEILIFDCIQTSVFKNAIRLNQPIIFFNFPRIELYKNAYNQLKKRCKIININFNNKKEFFFNKSALNKALKKSKKLVKNKSFLKEYFPIKI